MSKPAKKKCWSHSAGAYGSTIRVAEREPGGILYLLWVDNLGKQRKRSLRHKDRKRGRQEASELSYRLASGAEAREVTTPLSLREGVARAFDPMHGMYSGRSRHAAEARRAADRAVEILGGDLLWDNLTPGTMMYLVRVLAQGSEGGRGARSAELMCVVLYAIANWLRQERLISESAALPKRAWKAALRQEWQAVTGSRLEIQRPRHTMEEVKAIFGALPDGDPRLRLLVELAAELRAGQAVHAKRSDLALGPVGGFKLGRFVVHGCGKKGGEVVDLHPELRSLVDEVLADGYLSEAEVAYSRGEIEDYYLFPTGRLRHGKARVERCVAGHLDRGTLRELFLKVEELAGVEHKPGRAFYGLRRQATDLAPEFETDPRVLNRLTGHLDSATRERVYQDGQSDRVRSRAAEARQRMRHFLKDDGIGDGMQDGLDGQTYPRPIPLRSSAA
ncbi:hypothetical protein BH23GEM5_BH23GEM5_20720 [soil metagenome]